MKRIFTYITMLVMTMGMFGLTSCEDEDDYIAQKLRGSDWEGVIGTYYNNRWSGLPRAEYATVWHFESRGEYYTSGRGAELNYNINSPYTNYAYSTFIWCIVDGDIVLIYDDDIWQPLYITRYTLYTDRFRGYIEHGSRNERIEFDLRSTNYNDWDAYGSTGGYGDFRHQNWYRSRMTRSAEMPDDDVPFIDRTPLLQAEDGFQPCSVLSGDFARATQQLW